MCRRLLPLNALRAFEVAARHKSLAKAAEELAVTPAAVHHQVKSLEELLGVDLFIRKGNNLELTRAAASVLPTLEGAFDLLSLATEKMRQHASEGVLSLCTTPSFAQKWLVPRLGRFRDDFENIELHLSTAVEFPDLNNSEIDLAIGFGPEHRFQASGVIAEMLMRDEVFPVCSPDFLRRNHLATEAELLQANLLYDDGLRSNHMIDWGTWLSRIGIQLKNNHEGIKLDSTALAIDSAVAGQGIALAPRSLAEHDLATGRLVRLFERSMELEGAYFVAHLELISDRPVVAAFLEWLFAEARVNRALLSERFGSGRSNAVGLIN